MKRIFDHGFEKPKLACFLRDCGNVTYDLLVYHQKKLEEEKSQQKEAAIISERAAVRAAMEKAGGRSSVRR